MQLNKQLVVMCSFDCNGNAEGERSCKGTRFLYDFLWSQVEQLSDWMLVPLVTSVALFRKDRAYLGLWLLDFVHVVRAISVGTGFLSVRDSV